MSLYRALAKKSPVAIPPNATLSFEQTDNTSFTYNPDTGNNEPSVTTVEVKAALRRDRNSEIVGDRAMLSEEIHLLGYLFPESNELDTLDISQECRLRLTEPATGGTVEGDFTFQIRVSPFGEQIKAVIGIPIIGTLVMAGSGELR